MFRIAYEAAGGGDGETVLVKKPPRKPRPSEIAAKKAKAAAKKAAKRKPAPKARKATKAKRKVTRTVTTVARPERIAMLLIEKLKGSRQAEAA